jgi:hypothetical protein
MRQRGRHSRCLCGPGLGLGAKTPPSLSSIQCLGAFSRFRCFLGPRGTSGGGGEAEAEAEEEFTGWMGREYKP